MSNYWIAWFIFISIILFLPGYLLLTKNDKSQNETYNAGKISEGLFLSIIIYSLYGLIIITLGIKLNFTSALFFLVIFNVFGIIISIRRNRNISKPIPELINPINWHNIILIIISAACLLFIGLSNSKAATEYYSEFYIPFPEENIEVVDLDTLSVPVIISSHENDVKNYKIEVYVNGKLDRTYFEEGVEVDELRYVPIFINGEIKEGAHYELHLFISDKLELYRTLEFVWPVFK